MAKFELNTYGKDDEIIKSFKTDKVRWGVYVEAVKLEESGLINKPAVEQFKLINGLMKKVFPDLTDEDLESADSDDVMNTFRQLLGKGNDIETAESGSKNAVGTE